MDVIVELGSRKAFAAAVDWPGWCRSARDEQSAKDALAGYAGRYRLVAAAAGLKFPREIGPFTVVERLEGTGATDFGVPHEIARADARAVDDDNARRQVALLRAAWDAFDAIVAAAPPVLRKGPRGGGRDRDAIVEHVLESEATYARRLGIDQRAPAPHDPEALEGLRSALGDLLGRASDGAPAVPNGWPARYAARRIAWHVLDHAWEIEDKSEPDPAA